MELMDSYFLLHTFISVLKSLSVVMFYHHVFISDLLIRYVVCYKYLRKTLFSYNN
jgi:hypothetical protein